jgi:predicted metal-binding protein
MLGSPSGTTGKEAAMVRKKALEKMFERHGFGDFKWLDPKKIVVAQWPRMKCLYGCNEYGKTPTCPPNAPSVAECERFFREYRWAVLFHFEKEVARPEDRSAWTRKLNLRLLKLERDVFLSGHEKAFLLFLDSCNICTECPGKREVCKQPKMARPTADALAVDVYTTVRQAGYPIAVLSRYDQAMNRYAFLLIE